MKLKPILRRALMIGAVGGMAVTPLPVMGDTGSEQRLSFDVDEGLNLNSFLRDGPVAAHLLLRSGSDPRILIAFPAGNSGVGLWFSHSATPATWTLLGRPQPLIIKDERGRPLYGLTADARVTGVSELIDQAGRVVQRARLAGLSGRGDISGASRCETDDPELDPHLGARSPRRCGRISPQHRDHGGGAAGRAHHSGKQRRDLRSRSPPRVVKRR